MSSVEHLYRWSVYSELKVRIMKNRLLRLNYSSYIFPKVYNACLTVHVL